MAQSKKLATLLTTTGAAAQHTLRPDNFRRGFTVALDGSGAVSATILIQVSADEGATWATRVTFTTSGTASVGVPVTDADADANQPFPLVRVNVTALGAGTSVSVAVAASGEVAP